MESPFVHGATRKRQGLRGARDSWGGSDWTQEEPFSILSTITITHWNNLSREVMDSPTLDIFKIQLGRALARLARTMILTRKFDPDDP